MRSSSGLASRYGRNGGVVRMRAFTLVELLVALVVGGVAILGARSVLGALADHAGRVSDAAADADRVANGERLLRALVGNLEIGTTEDATFSGNEREARFTTWCPTPSGWQERCSVRLVVIPPDSAGAASVVAGVLPTGEVLPLLEGTAVQRIRYLRDAANGGTWFHTWGAGITAPLAIGIMTDRDTVIVRIGERG